MFKMTHHVLQIFCLITFLTNSFKFVSSVPIYNSSGQLNIAFIIHNCEDALSAAKKTVAHAGIWSVQRLNDLKVYNLTTTEEFWQFGVNVQTACSQDDYFKSIFALHEQYANEDSEILLGIVFEMSNGNVARNVFDFASLLKIDVITMVKSENSYLEEIKAAVKLLETLNWVDEIEVVAPNQQVLKEFYRKTRRDWMCVNRFHMHETFIYDSAENSTHPIVFLGSAKEISQNLNKLQLETVSNSSDTIGGSSNKLLLVPFDGEEIPNLKDNMLVLNPLLADMEEPYEPPKILPSPIFFDVALSVLTLTHSLSTINCSNVTTLKECANDHQLKQAEFPDTLKTPTNILEFFKIESLASEFIYKITHANSTLFTYSYFEDSLSLTEASTEFKKPQSNSTCFQEFDRCLLECENFKTFEVSPLFPTFITGPFAIALRPEPWVYAFFSLSLLGTIFCLSITCFILSRLCKKQVLEGNPILTILLLLDTIIMFASVLPFAFEGNKSTRYQIYLIRSLCTTLPYTFAFALLLSRTILLATVSREVGFMSHVAGSVQGFLTLFIFAVQCALNLQLTSNSGCDSSIPNTGSSSLLSLMSYNAVLLILLVFITPLIAKSKRNYQEGKYFTIAIVLLAGCWSCWLPAYAVLDEGWKDPLLCLGLVSTGSILLGCIFIPRTYMMTVSAARERFTSALPSLATATSAMDIYRASTQPVYDCVNVAAIAAANLRAQHEQERRQQADFYSAPNDNEVDEEEEEEDEFVVQTSDSPPIDKVTRF